MTEKLASTPAENKPAAIEVLAVRHLDGRSAVRAFVDFRVGGIVVKGAKVIQQEGQKPWLATPSIRLDRGWQQVVEIVSKPLRERITEVVLAAWQERPIRAPTRGTATRERTPPASEPPEPFYDDSEAAIRDLREGGGWEDRGR